jgi:hypothetical protein
MGCPLCMFVVGKVKDGLSDPVTRDQIRDKTAAACATLPEGPMRDTCNQWAKQYGGGRGFLGAGQRGRRAGRTDARPPAARPRAARRPPHETPHKTSTPAPVAAETRPRPRQTQTSPFVNPPSRAPPPCPPEESIFEYIDTTEPADLCAMLGSCSVLTRLLARPPPSLSRLPPQ